MISMHVQYRSSIPPPADTGPRMLFHPFPFVWSSSRLHGTWPLSAAVGARQCLAASSLCLAASLFDLCTYPFSRRLHTICPRYKINKNKIKGFNDFRQHVLNLAGDTKRFPPSKLPPTWVEADRLVKLRREEGHHILSVRDLVAGLGKDSYGVGASQGGRAEEAREGGEGWEDSRNAVVSTVRGEKRKNGCLCVAPHVFGLGTMMHAHTHLLAQQCCLSPTECSNRGRDGGRQ